MITMDKKKKEKLLVYTGAIVLFCFVMWLIFSPSASDEKAEQKGKGLNTELPEGKGKPFAQTKKEAYKDEEKEDNSRMHSMSDYIHDLSNKNKEEQASTGYYNSDGVSGAKAQLKQFERIQSDDAEFNNLAANNLALEQEIYRLRQENKQNKIKNSEVDAKELMEESYRLAAKYRNSTSVVGDTDSYNPEKQRGDVEITGKIDNEVVSTLADNLELDMPYNYGFNTAVGSGYQTGKNTVRACIHEDQTVSDGQRIKLRLLEPLQAGSLTIPKGQVIAGIARIQRDRMDIEVNSIEYAGNIIPVAMQVYDTDGTEGIYCPGSEELNAVKDAAANIGSGLGSSISFAQSAGQQIAMDLTRGVMSGGSQYLSNKLRLVTVKMKKNYEVFLLPKK